MGDADEHARYGVEVRPLSLETGGRISSEGLSTLASLAVDAATYGKRRLGRRAGLNLQQVRQRLEALVVAGVADATLRALGSNGFACLGWRPSNG
eukprot:12422821-Karenia_brevis.AAC.1